jgi:hypothetical protein
MDPRKAQVPDMMLADLGLIAAGLEAVDPRLCDPAQAAALRGRLGEAILVDAPDGRRIVRGEVTLGTVSRHGTVTLHMPDGPPRCRVLDLDRRGHVTSAIRRGRQGEVLGAWLRNVDGTLLEIRPRATRHPLWGWSDGILGPPADAAGEPTLRTVCAATDWDAPAAIPALAEPSRLPAGAGTSILGLLATLAADRGAPPLRYRGPYPTEQLFWALVEAFRFEPAEGDPAGGDPVALFTRDAETLATRGESRQAPLAWRPAPPERLFHDGGIYVQLRDGVEKVWWEGRTYYRPDWQGFQRREHRVVRRTATGDGRALHVAALEAGGRRLEDHLVLDEAGDVVACPARDHETADDRPDQALDRLWRDALGTLVPLEATPLLASALAAVWPELRPAWGSVRRDLVEVRGLAVRLSIALADLYRLERATGPAGTRRGAAQTLVRTVVGLVGGPARACAAQWLASQSAARREMLLAEAAATDRRQLAARAAVAVGTLIDALEAGAALPDPRTPDPRARGT